MSVSTVSEASSSVREASYPFNKPEADFILRSSDQVDFRVRRHILFEASPVFESILSIPQPASTNEVPSTLPTVDLTEDSTTLDVLLRICYPIVKPTTTRSFDQIESALKAAQKYEMELPLAMLTEELQAAIPRSPLKAWAVACRTRLETVARAVAQHSLNTSTLDFTVLGRMDDICAGDYYRFIQFRRLMGAVEASFQLLNPLSTPNSFTAVSESDPVQSDEAPELPCPDIACQSPDGTRFLAHKAFLSAASPVLQKEIDALLPSNDISPASTLPVLHLAIGGNIMPSVIRLCYPSTMRSPADLQRLAAVYAAVRKYNMNRIAEELNHRWETASLSDPLTAYLVASHHGLDDLARETAKHTLTKDIDHEYREAMELCPAISYHNLLGYRATCHKIGVDAIASIFLGPQTSSPWSQSSSSTQKFTSFSGITATASQTHISDQQPPPSTSRSSPVFISAITTSTTTWLPDYMDKIRKTANEHPGQLLSGSGFRPFEDATTAKQWCIFCQLLAGKLSRVASALDNIPAQVHAVTLTI